MGEKGKGENDEEKTRDKLGYTKPAKREKKVNKTGYAIGGEEEEGVVLCQGSNLK